MIKPLLELNLRRVPSLVCVHGNVVENGGINPARPILQIIVPLLQPMTIADTKRARIAGVIVNRHTMRTGSFNMSVRSINITIRHTHYPRFYLAISPSLFCRSCSCHNVSFLFIYHSSSEDE